VGALLFYLLQELIEQVTEYWLLWFGVVLLALVLGFRGGVVGYFQHHVLPALRRRLS